MRIAITGGSGFVGRAITRQLIGTHEVVWLSTRNTTLPTEFDSVTLKTVDYQSVASIEQAINGCDAVIHLVGILHQSTEITFDEVHHQLPKRIIEATANAGIKSYLHMSALGIAADAPSQYLISKYNGETESFTIAKQREVNMLSFRPSVIFGKEDEFFNLFAKLLKYSPVFPVVCPDAQFQPVHVDDVAAAFLWGLDNLQQADNFSGKVYELVGKDVLTMRQTIETVCDHYGWKRLLIPLPDTITKIQGKMLSYLPNPPFTYDNYLSMQTPNTSKRWDWDEMNIEPRPINLSEQLK